MLPNETVDAFGPYTANDMQIHRLRAESHSKRASRHVNDSIATDRTTPTLVFSLLCFPWELERVLALARLLLGERSFLAVHITGLEASAASKLEQDLFRLGLAPNRFKVLYPAFPTSWGGISLVYAELALLLHFSAVPGWNSVINLSCADFPLHSIDRMLDRVAWLNQTSLISHWYAPDRAQRLEKHSMECIHQKRLTPISLVLPDTLRVNQTEGLLIGRVHHYSASQWHLLSHAFVDELLFACARCWELLWRLRLSSIPDEHFFAIVAANRWVSAPVSPVDSTYKKWQGDISCDEWRELSLKQRQLDVRQSEFVFFARKVAGNEDWNCMLRYYDKMRSSTRTV